jgi:hypothetical protein
MMTMTLRELILAFGRKKGTYVYGTIFVYKRFKFPRVRHDEPFAKRKAGKLRRDARYFNRHQKEQYLHA